MKYLRTGFFIITLLFIGVALNSCNHQFSIPGGQTYYVGSESGNDANTGTEPGEAWASLEKVNQMNFQPGDRLLFKAGTGYTGQFKPEGSGKKGNPIVVNSYGEGDKPAIHGEGQYKAAVLLENIEYWEVNNLEVTNKGNDREPGRRGVIVRAWNFGDCHHVVLDSLDIHDVNGSLIKKKGAGSAILWQNGGDSVKTRFVDLVISNCHLYACERNGINSRGYTNRKNWHPSIGVVVKNNLLEQIPGDGIVPLGCHGAVIEHNVMRDCPDILPHSEAAAGIWPWSSDSTIIQYNEVSGHKAKWDGQGFDSDWNCRNTIIQYNYSHDNYGGFLLVCNNGNNIGSNRNIGTLGTIIRYNVSINDGIRPYPTRRKGWFSPTMHLSGPIEKTLIYNNVFIIPGKPGEKIDRTLLEMDNWGGPWPENTQIANNILYIEDQAGISWGESKGHTMKRNMISGTMNNVIDRKNNLFDNPGWQDLGAVSDDKSSLKNLQLKPGSPCIDKGVKMAEQVIRDFFGNEVTPGVAPDIGIHEFSSR